MKNKNKFKNFTVFSCASLSMLISSQSWALRAGARLDAQMIAEKAVQAAINSDNKGSLATLETAQEALNAYNDAGALNNLEAERQLRTRLNQINQSVQQEQQREKTQRVSEEAKLSLQQILENIRARQHSAAVALHLKTKGLLREGIVKDLAADFSALDKNKLTLEDINQLLTTFSEYAYSESTAWQIAYANKAKMHKEGYLEYEGFYFDYLTSNELAQLFVMIQTLSAIKHDLLAPFVFDIKDKLIRMSYVDDSIRQSLLRKVDDSTEHNRQLKQILARLHDGHLDFYPLIDATGESFKSIDSAAFEAGKAPINKPADLNKIVVFQAAYEAPNIKIGGLGAFLSDFAAALSKHDNIDLHFISQHCDFLKRSHPYATFSGFVDHQVYGQAMRSTIYAIELQGGIKQYLIKPDPAIARLFDLGKAHNIYKAFKHAEYKAKMAYFNSALATVAATYRGANGDQSVDILHLHSWHTTVAAALMNIQLNPLRESYGLQKVRILSTVHMHGAEQGIMGAKLFTNVGLDLPEGRQKASKILKNNVYEHPGYVYDEHSITYGYDEHGAAYTFEGYDDGRGKFFGFDAYGNILGGYEDEPIFDESGHELEVVNLLIETANHVDFINTVSPSLAEDMQDPAQSYGVHNVFSKLSKEGRFAGILNGINTDKFDPQSASVLGRFAVNAELSNISQQKQAAKKALYAAGIISDPNKPLFIYIGRFSAEKGIDYLPAIAQEIADNGGQMLVMGMTPYQMPSSIKQLIKMQESHPVKVFTNLSAQLEVLEDAQAKKGMLARFAADYTLIPSKMESCGLVAIEALCMGSFIAVSYTQGLKSLCTPFDNDPAYTEENCIKYDYIFGANMKTEENIRTMIRRSFELERMLSPEQKASIQKSIIKKSKQYDWNNENGSVYAYINIYEKLLSGR